MRSVPKSTVWYTARAAHKPRYCTLWETTAVSSKTISSPFHRCSRPSRSRAIRTGAKCTRCSIWGIAGSVPLSRTCRRGDCYFEEFQHRCTDCRPRGRKRQERTDYQERIRRVQVLNIWQTTIPYSKSWKGLFARFEEVSTLITDPAVIADQKALRQAHQRI